MRLYKIQSKFYDLTYLRQFFSLLFLVVSFLASPSYAQSSSQSDVTSPENEEESDESNMQAFERLFIDSNVVISNWFDSVAEGIDLFFVNKKITDEPSKINARLINASYIKEGEGYINRTALSVSPRFHNLEKYWNLKFSTYDELEDGRGVRRGFLRQTPREQNYGATVGLFRRLGAVRVAFQPRIELQDPLQVSHSLGFESVWDFQTFKANPKLEFYASASKGPGTFHSMNFNFYLSDIYSLTWINEGDYEANAHKYSVTTGLTLGQQLSETTSMSYSFLTYADNRDNYHLNGYNLSLSWYQLIYNKILDYQIIPHLDFKQDDEFRGRAGLTFQFTVYF